METRNVTPVKKITTADRKDETACGSIKFDFKISQCLRILTYTQSF